MRFHTHSTTGGHQYKDGASALDAALSSEDIDPKVEAWYLNNHISITIKTHSDSAYDGKRVVQVEVEPKSILHSHNDWKEGEEPSHMTVETECVDPEQMNRPAMIIDGKGVQKNKDGDVVVVWTYDVSWEPSEIHWASRWDIYLSMNDKYDDEIHWFGIVNSLFMVFLLTGLIAIIMMRTLLPIFDDIQSHSLNKTAWNTDFEQVHSKRMYPTTIAFSRRRNVLRRRRRAVGN